MPPGPGDDCNLASYFVDARLSEGSGSRVALICGDSKATYAELAELVNRVGNGLRGLGLSAGDRALLAVSDGVEFVAIWYACQKLGLVTAECYTFLQPKDYAYYLSYTQAGVVFVDATTIGAVRQATGSEAVAGQRPRATVALGVPPAALLDGEVGFDSLIEDASAQLAAVAVGRDDVAVWKFTTGSTGSPKACVHSARHPIDSYLAYARGVLGLEPADRILPIPKLFFGYARDLAALYPFGVGAAGIVFPGRSTVDVIFELIAAHRPTILVNVPTMIGSMVAHPDAAAQDLSCLRLCTSAGEALPAELHRRWLDTFGVEVLDGIGSSEAYHIYISNRPGRVRSGTVGEPVPGYSARVLSAGGAGAEAEPASAAEVSAAGYDTATAPPGAAELAGAAALPDGEIGRLAVTGPTVALEYFGDAERTRRTFHRSTVVSEDLFVRHADGYFSYVGRADDLLKVSGIWVAPAEIEECLLGHPDVIECAVVGRQAQGLVKAQAYVVLSAGSTATEAALQAHVRDRLAPYKVPRGIRFVEALPRTANGKIDRKGLTAPAG
jgi:acyl-coenzyme A synthetase/AMP-(fatty) acid ligase